MKIRIVTALLCTLLFSFSKAQNKDSSSAQIVTIPGWKTYSQDNISIQYPGDWNLKKNPQTQTVFFLMAPIDTTTPDFDINVNLIIQNLKGQEMDLDKYIDISVKQFKDYLTNDSIMLNKKEKDNLGEYEHLINDGIRGTNHFIFDQYLRIIDGKTYILTLTLLKTQWDKYHEVGEEILNTFSVKQ